MPKKATDKDRNSNGADRKPERKRVKLTDLVPNEGQAETYHDLGTEEFNSIMQDICERGMDDPIVVLPPVKRGGQNVYEIIDGHQRKKMAEQLGWADVEVLIRHDLENASLAEKRVVFINANLLRRQLDTASRVLAAIRKYEWQNNNGEPLSIVELQGAREEIGKIIGLSGRAISRYLRLARTPMAVQRAVSDGLVPLVIGERAADLNADQQAVIAERIGAATDKNQVREIFREFGLDRSGGHKHAHGAFLCFVQEVNKSLSDLHGRLETLCPFDVNKHVQTLKKFQKLSADLIAIAAKAKTMKSPAEELQDMVSKVQRKAAS